jgi:hypothetical protein
MAIKVDTFTGGGGAGAVTSVNGNTGAVTLSGDDLAADHTASNYTAANANIDGHLSGIDTKLGTIAAGLTYKGTFNATTGAPSLANALQGDLYIIGTAGTIYGQTWAIGDHLLINADMGGSITNSKIDKIDNTDQVTSVNGNTGAVVVNLQSVTDQSGVTTGTVQAGVLKSPVVRVGTGVNFYEMPGSDGAANQVLATDGSGSLYFKNETTGAVTSVNGNTGAVTLSGDDLAADHTASNYTAANANIDGHLSGIDSKFGTLGTASTAASSDFLASTAGLNDLSDVSFTAGAGIDNYVLTYDHANTRWQAEAAASGGLSEVVQDTTPQLGGNLDVNGNSITSASNGNVTINPDGTGDISIGADLIPDADGTHTIGSESARYVSYYGDVNGAIRFKAKNDSGAQITKGQVVYIKGISGTVPTVDLAEADVSSKMPAFGLALANANDQAEVQIISFGNLNAVDTSSFSAGDTLFVSTTAGALTATKPTGESALIQNVGRVLRSDASAGIIKVGGAGRIAATPNLDQNKIFLGNASNQAVSTALSSINLSSLNNDLSFLSNVVEDTTPQLGGNLDVNGNSITSASNGDIELAPDGNGSVKIKGNATSGSGRLILNCEQNTHGITLKGPPHSATANYTLTFPNTDGNANQVLKTDGSGALDWVDQTAAPAAASETVAGVIEIATNAEAAAATATDKALVPSNISSLELSDMDNTTSGFIANINSESLNDLSDVNFTAGAGIDNYVLTYDHANTRWQAEAAAGGGGSAPDVVTDSSGTNTTISTTTGISEVHLISNGANNVTITLPAAATAGEGYRYEIKRLGTGSVTIDPNGSEYIDHSGQTTFAIGAQYDSVSLVTDGSNWFLI